MWYIVCATGKNIFHTTGTFLLHLYENIKSNMQLRVCIHNIILDFVIFEFPYWYIIFRPHAPLKSPSPAFPRQNPSYFSMPRSHTCFSWPHKVSTNCLQSDGGAANQNLQESIGIIIIIIIVVVVIIIIIIIICVVLSGKKTIHIFIVSLV